MSPQPRAPLPHGLRRPPRIGAFRPTSAAILLIAVAAACHRGSSSQNTTTPPSAGGPPRPPRDVSVLFLGNSYTSSNNLPRIVRDLATAGGRSLIPVTSAPDGNTLGAPQVNGTAHASNSGSLALIGSKSWDFVVLQEQSEIPAIQFMKETYMLPAVSVLNAVVKANDSATKVVLFQTWGRDMGGQFCIQGCSPDYPDFDSMQDDLTAAYQEAAQSISATVTPVGEAWRIARDLDPSLALHQADGSHPTQAGSYLAACMFYAHLYDSSPVGIDFASTLQPDVATFLQAVSAEATWGATCGLESYGTSTNPPNLLTLTGTGDTGPGGVVSLTPGGLKPGDPGTLLFSSFAKAFLPLSSGVLLIDLTKPVLPTRFITNGDSWTLTVPPEPEFTGLDLYFQVLADDSTNPGMTLFSPGVHLQVCP